MPFISAVELQLNTEDLLSLLRGLFTLSQDLARDEMGAERVGVIGRGRLWDRDDDGGGGGVGVGSSDCGCCGGVCSCCGATVIFVDSGVQPEVYCLFGGGDN